MRKDILLLLASISVLGLLCNSKTSSKVDYGVPPANASTSSANLNGVLDEGTIGDVKYSLLPPQQFIKVNGNGWVLMKGQDLMSLNPDAVLLEVQQQFQITDKSGRTTLKLPDARGMFLRGMNEGRAEKDGGNPYPNTAFGVYQPDMFLHHTHTLQNVGFHSDNLSGGRDGTRGAEYSSLGDHSLNDINGLLKLNEAGENNLETRPRHIALYVYAKIRKSS